jgi:hypothetical protein
VAGVSDYASQQTRGPHQNELRARLFELHPNPNSPRQTAEAAPHHVEGFAASGGAHEFLPTAGSDKRDDADQEPRSTVSATELRYRGHNKYATLERTVYEGTLRGRQCH